MPAHTPGPWVSYDNKVASRTILIRQYGVRPESGRAVARVFSQDAEGERNANARLIAAAPRMLEMVRRLALGAGKPFDHPDARAMQKAGDEARAILRDVEGRQHENG